MGTAACFLIVLPIVSGAIPQSRKRASFLYKGAQKDVTDMPPL